MLIQEDFRHIRPKFPNPAKNLYNREQYADDWNNLKETGTGKQSCFGQR